MTSSTGWTSTRPPWWPHRDPIPQNPPACGRPQGRRSQALAFASHDHRGEGRWGKRWDLVSPARGLQLQSRGHVLRGGAREEQFAPFHAWAWEREPALRLASHVVPSLGLLVHPEPRLCLLSSGATSVLPDGIAGVPEGRVYLEWRSYRHRKSGELVYYQAWSAWIRIAKGVIRKDCSRMRGGGNVLSVRSRKVSASRRAFSVPP